MDNFFPTLREKNIERQKIWDSKGQIKLDFRLLEFFGECGELANLIKKDYRESLGLVGSRVEKKQFEEEIADVVITLDLYRLSMGNGPIYISGNVWSYQFSPFDVVECFNDIFSDPEYGAESFILYLQELCRHYDLKPLEECVRNKFNETSRKVGIDVLF